MYVPNSAGTFFWDHLEPIGTQEATKHTIEILDADYKKVNLPNIAKDTYRHSFSVEQGTLLLY